MLNKKICILKEDPLSSLNQESPGIVPTTCDNFYNLSKKFTEHCTIYQFTSKFSSLLKNWFLCQTRATLLYHSVGCVKWYHRRMGVCHVRRG